MELPTHPSQDDDHAPATGPNWAMVLVLAIVVAAVATLVVLHLTGIVGPAAD